MQYYRLTKYNPQYRDAQGYFKKHTWTSFSDIGGIFDHEILTLASYYETEDAYVKAVNAIFIEKGVSWMTLSESDKIDFDDTYARTPQEKKFYESARDAMQLSIGDAEMAIRLTLREFIWCKLSCAEKNIEITFGYDYYMYIRCDEISAETRKAVSDCGLYLEQIEEDAIM